MTEEIIVDGVNVAECEHRSDIHKTLLADGAIKEFSNYCYISNDGCYNINCYYKQLQRLQAELKNEKEIAKLEIVALNQACFDLKTELDEKIEEYKEVKEKHKRLTLRILELNSLNNTLIASCENCIDLKKYKQALKEIEELINFRFKTQYMTLGLKETDKIIEDIDKIINEVLNG